MSDISVTLSAEGLERGASISDEDFTFILNDTEYHCSKFQAAFISPRIQALLSLDKTIDTFVIDCPTKQSGARRLFGLFGQAMHGHAITVEASQIEDFLTVASYLQND
jgi:hypothetical protein